MKAKVLRSFVATIGDKRIRASEGEEIELPEDDVRSLASLVEPIEDEAKKKPAAKKKAKPKAKKKAKPKAKKKAKKKMPAETAAIETGEKAVMPDASKKKLAAKKK